MQRIIDRYGIDAVWHFTDQSNYAQIKSLGGVYSLREIERRGIKVPVYGGDQRSHDLDRHKGLDRYVHLCFEAYHPMCYRAEKEGRIPNPVYLRIDASVLLKEGVRFCSEVSTTTGAILLDAQEAESKIDFEVLFFTDMDGKNPSVKERLRAAQKSEILIPDFIPIDLVVAQRYG